jgi:hypothetical protein
MTQRIYWADIIECEEQLFESLDALIAVATETPECFITGWSDQELVSVDTNEEMELVITYTTTDDYDDNGDEILKTETESFRYDYQKELAVLVP